MTLSGDRWNQVLVPKGFAHGMVTLEEATEVLIKISAPYSPAHEGVIRYDDPQIGVDWQLDGIAPTLSDKDQGARPLCEQDTGFVYGQC